MSIRVVCAQCHTSLEVSETAAGRKGRCPTCQAVMDIPRAGHSTGDGPTAAGDTVLVRCSECGLQLQVDAASAGKKGRCPHCQAITSIPSAAGQRGAEKPADFIVVTCRECQTQLQVSVSAAGKKGRCPSCQGVMDIPSLAAPAAKLQPERSPHKQAVSPKHSEAVKTTYTPASPALAASAPPSPTRYVPATSREAMAADPPAQGAAPTAGKPTRDRRPLKTYDENALLELPPGEPPPRPPEPEPAVAASPEPPPIPPPVIERHKTPAAAPPPGKRVPPQLIRPPISQAEAAPQDAQAKAATAVDLEPIAPLTRLAPMTAIPVASRPQKPPIVIQRPPAAQ